MEAGTLTVIAGRPGAGKSALVNTICAAMLRESWRAAALVYSTEVSTEEWLQRLLCTMARVNLADVRAGRLNEREAERVLKAAERVDASGFVVPFGRPFTSLELFQLTGSVRGGAPLMVDTLTGVELSTNRKRVDRKEALAEIAQGLRAAAVNDGLPVIATVPLSDAVDARAGHRPRLGDLPDNGTIADLADVIICIHRDDYYALTAEKTGLAELIVLKNRHGPTGTVEVGFQGPSLRFTNLNE